MEQKLNELKGSSGNSSSGLVFLLAESFGTLSQDRENITLQSLTFRNSKMDIQIDSANLQSIETLNKKLNENKKLKPPEQLKHYFECFCGSCVNLEKTTCDNAGGADNVSQYRSGG